MANKYDDADGVWRTIGGRRVFIRNGQSLSDAMKESGKFNTKKKQDDYEKKVYGSDVKKVDEQMKKTFGEDFKYAEELSKQADEYVKSGLKLTERDAKDLLKALNDEGSDFTFDEDITIEDGKIKTNVGVFMPDERGYVNRELEIPLSENETYDSLEEKMRDWEDRHRSVDDWESTDFVSEAEAYYSKQNKEDIKRDLEQRFNRLKNDYYDEKDKEKYQKFYDDGMKFYNEKYGKEDREEKAKELEKLNKQAEEYAKTGLKDDNKDVKYDSVEDRYNNDKDFRDMLEKEHNKTLDATRKEIKAYLDNEDYFNKNGIESADDLYNQINDNYYNISRDDFDKLYDEETKLKSLKNDNNYKEYLKKEDAWAKRNLNDDEYKNYVDSHEEKYGKGYLDSENTKKVKNTPEYEKLRDAYGYKYDKEPIETKTQGEQYEDYKRAKLGLQTNEQKSTKLSSNSGQEKISDNVKVMRYGDDYVVLKNGHNEKEFKNQSDAESYAKTLTNNETMNEKIRNGASKKSYSADEEDILDRYSKDYGYDDKDNLKNLKSQIDYMRIPNESIHKTAERLVGGGDFLIYNEDIKDWLKERNIKYNDDNFFDVYKREMADKIEKLYNSQYMNNKIRNSKKK